MFYLWSVCLLLGLWGLVVAWLVGSCLYVVILYQADALFPNFLGEVLSVLFSGCLLARCIVLCLLGHCPLVINSYLSKKKKKKRRPTPLSVDRINHQSSVKCTYS